MIAELLPDPKRRYETDHVHEEEINRKRDTRMKWFAEVFFWMMFTTCGSISITYFTDSGLSFLGAWAVTTITFMSGFLIWLLVIALAWST